tara:strand:- start:15 stop:509 length:495 start_codon:yes stop_codon:yes gene_type:complete
MYEVIDNFLDNEDFNILKKNMLGGFFPWYFSNEVTESSKDEKLSKNYYMIHSFYDKQSNDRSNHFSLLNPILNKLNINSLIRIKGNLYPHSNKLIYHKKHRDYEYKHNGAIFFLNSNDGFTILNDNINIKSIANRILFFDSSKSHNSTNCTNEKVRVNINFNYI